MENNISINASIKTPEAESEAPTRIHPIKPLLNGVLKRHLNPTPAPAAAVVTYKECLKNHAATMGGHAVDGCGEFMPSPSTDPANPSSLKCAACGCHRNFHRRDPEESPPSTAVIEYQPHHRHHPPPPPPAQPRGGAGHSSPKSNSASPPPISSSYMLLALSGGGAGLSCPAPPQHDSRISPGSSSGRKRFRTKFTPGQKERMLQFAERVGWKMQRKDEELIAGFCGEIGVDKGVFKVWMHNNKSTFGKSKANGNSGFEIAATTPPVSSNYNHGQDNNNGGSAQAANGSSSSS